MRLSNQMIFSKRGWNGGKSVATLWLNVKTDKKLYVNAALYKSRHRLETRPPFFWVDGQRLGLEAYIGAVWKQYHPIMHFVVCRTTLTRQLASIGAAWMLDRAATRLPFWRRTTPIYPLPWAAAIPLRFFSIKRWGPSQSQSSDHRLWVSQMNE